MTESHVTGENQAVEKIEEFQKFGSILGLDRMNVLLEMLGNPHKDLKVIHVAGTNGKGSICKYVYSVLRANGYRVGLFTSPFIEVFNERIEMDGQYISDEDLAHYTEIVLEKTKKMVKEGYQSPTEFEVITAIMFLYFKEKNPDFVVLEVGLGGKGDSTNVIEAPLVTVIASISFDHTDRLGNTLAEIAAEKAGIIKENCPVVVSADKEEALEVIRQVARERNAQIIETRNVRYNVLSQDVAGSTFETTILGQHYDELSLSMGGRHQISNAIAAMTALRLLEENGHISLSNEKTYYGLEAAKQKGRFEVIQKKPYVILDGAHNPDGAKALENAVLSHFEGKRILMVTGMLADKDTDSILGSFVNITKEFIATEPDNPRKLGALDLMGKIKALGGSGEAYTDLEEACKVAMSKAGDYDLVLFSGSLYLIGAIRTLLMEERND